MDSPTRGEATVPFTLPLTLGPLQSSLPFVLQASHDRIIVPYSGIEGLTFLTGLFAGPALAAEVVTRRAGIPDAPCPRRDPIA